METSKPKVTVIGTGNMGGAFTEALSKLSLIHI